MHSPRATGNVVVKEFSAILAFFQVCAAGCPASAVTLHSSLSQSMPLKYTWFGTAPGKILGIAPFSSRIKQVWPSSHGSHTSPPQSTPDSQPFCTPSAHVSVEGDAEGLVVGDAEASDVGVFVGDADGLVVGDAEGIVEGVLDGDSDGVPLLSPGRPVSPVGHV